MGAVILMDSFDRYTEGSGPSSYSSIWSWGGLEQDPVRIVPGRFEGSSAVSLGTVGRDYHSWRYIGVPISEACIGAAIKIPEHGPKSLLGFGSMGTEALSLIKNNIGQIEVRRGRGFGDASVLLASSTKANLLPPGGWHYVEFGAMGGINGAAKVWVNGELVLDAAGIDCGADFWNSFGLGMNGGYRQFDDFYMSAGSINRGEVRIDALDVIADTAVADFTHFGADTAWQAISEPVVDGDVSYITSNTVGARSIFELENASSTIEDVLAVQVRGYASKLDAGTRAIRYFLRNGTAESAGADHYLAVSYVHTFDVHNAKPGGGAWTPGAIDTMKLGVEVVV